ncbi:MAG: DMT family transporter [Armatimonadota bacterium]
MMMYDPRTHLSADTRSRLLGILFVLAAITLWSTVPIGTKLLVGAGGTSFSPAFISAARLWVAALIFMLIQAVHARRAGTLFYVPIKQKRWLFIAAGALAVNYIFYAVGLRYTTAISTTVISQVHSVTVVLLAALLLGEALTKRKIAGMIIALCGVLLAFFRGSSLQDLLASRFFYGNLIELFAAVIWSFYAIGQTKLLHDSGNRQALMPIFAVAALLATAALPFTGPLISGAPAATDWFAVLFLGVASTAAAYWLFAAGLQRIDTSEGAMFNVLMPPLSLLLAHWLLREPIRPTVISGLALVVVGLILILWRRSQSAATKRTAKALGVPTHPHSAPQPRPRRAEG